MFNSGELLAIIGMGVFVFLAMMIGGFVLLHPLARRLGDVMDQWLRIRRSEIAGENLLGEIHSELGGLRGSLETMADRLDRLEERQEFTETLIERKETGVLPPSPDR